MDSTRIDASTVVEFLRSPRTGMYVNLTLITAGTLFTVLGLIEFLLGVLIILIGAGGLVVALSRLE